MTPEQHKEAAAFHLAVAEGKVIQREYDGKWLDCSPDVCQFNVGYYKFRVKPPERRKARVIEMFDGKFREVLPEDEKLRADFVVFAKKIAEYFHGSSGMLEKEARRLIAAATGEE